MKKIVCLIESLGAGGAERQMSELSSLLKDNGYDVEVWYYAPKHFYREAIENAGVSIKYISRKKSRLIFLYDLFTLMKHTRPDVVIAYSLSASLFACVLRILGLNYKLIVSERNTNIRNTMMDRLRFNVLRLADQVVANSYSQTEFICKNYSFLTDKTLTIINCVNTDVFFPYGHPRKSLFIVVATLWESKNTLNFIRSLKILKDKGYSFNVKWFGKSLEQLEYFHKCVGLIQTLELENYIVLEEKTPNIMQEYQKADAFCLPSFYEGTPNSLLEAMSCALPVACSNICDNPRYIADGKNGFLFDPNDIEDIACALEKLMNLSDADMKMMGENNREVAIKTFGKQTFIEKYLRIIE